MQCPKCHTIISDNETVCPKCHKVLLLECPNCHSLEETAVCTQCGYKILVKCSKCGRINPAINDLCVQCGFSTKASLALQECESDEFAYVTIRFTNLKKIKRLLKSKDLYEKFLFKLKNLVLALVKNAEGLFITYGDIYALNFNKELSFPTSANKAVRFALKIANAFTQLNLKILEELRLPLGLNITIAKKNAEELQDIHIYDNNVKLLNLKKDIKKYLKGTQIIIDQYVWDEINKEYKTDSLFSTEENGQTTMFYEVVLDSYVLPPDTEKDDEFDNVGREMLPKVAKNEDKETDMYSFNVFDINAKCSFEITNAVAIRDKLSSLSLDKKAKILALRSKAEYRADTADIREFFEKEGYRTLTINCTEAMNYEPWGFFVKLFKAFYNLPFLNKNTVFDDRIPKTFEPLFNLCKGISAQASTSEDARFMYIELWGKFMACLSNTAVIVDGFEHLDDSSIQAITLYLDKLRNIAPNFVFITNEKTAAHSKMKDLLRMDSYTELKLIKSSFSDCLSTIKINATDFIDSFYFEKIKENFNGSYLYFKYAIKYLMDTGVLISFENKLLVKGSKSVVIPGNLFELYKARMKYLGKKQDISLIMAYSSMLYSGMDLSTFELLGIQDLNSNVKILIDSGLAKLESNNLIINNISIFNDIILASIKKEAEVMLAKNIMAKAGPALDKASIALNFGKMGAFGEEYSTLCYNADLSIAVGDYDAYLKNCLGFLSLIDKVVSIVDPEDIDARKKEVYDSILKYLYAYTPTKIYFIENILLTDAINENDNERIVRLSNMMLQGALISSNYTEALGLLHNILSRMEHPTLTVDGAVNAKFFLLSLVNMEILYNIGKFKECVETAMEIISVLNIDIIDKIKPAGFSTNSFVSHILETLRLASFAKLYLMEDDLDDFINNIENHLGTDFPDKDCIYAIRDFLGGKIYDIGAVENYSAFSKTVFLILQEISNLQAEEDYAKFAQNIFQAKLLAEDICQMEIKYLCDLLIGYAYAKQGVEVKAEYIYEDVLNIAEKSAMFNILILAKYFLARLEKEPQDSILIVSDALDIIRKHENQAVILYVLFEKMYINYASQTGVSETRLELETQKLNDYKEKLKLILE